jgi:hypothetical protein
VGAASAAPDKQGRTRRFIYGTTALHPQLHRCEGAAPTAESSHTDITEHQRSSYTDVAAALTPRCLQAA